MAHRSSLFSLSALTRAYQRNLKALTRATRPARAKAVKAVKAEVKKTVKRAVKRAVEPAPQARPRPPAGPGARSKTSASQGDWIAGVVTGPAGARRFHLYVPPGLALRGGEKLPLLVMLHGCDQTGVDLASSSRMNRLAARHRFLVLYPEQERMANARGCWNWYGGRSGKAHAEAATLLAAVQQVALRHPVDLARVAVVGLSAGASMAVLMAARYPAHFCAVAMHSGVAPGSAESAATALAAMRGRRAGQLPLPHLEAALANAVAMPAPLPPLLVLHGDADGVVSARNAADTAQLWAQALGGRAGTVRTQQRGKRYPMRVTEFKARGRTVVVLREIVGLRHAWSGGAPGLPYSDPAGPDASALVWAFVAREFKRVAAK
ncbi:MAG: PHB depolymerase family esterase [Simplicispira sp.]|nr:PHB depolymerase family esterase [Simplicispira sp.]